MAADHGCMTHNHTTTFTRLGHLTMAWGVLFALVHAYWAAGGEAGMRGDAADTTGAQLYVAFIAVLGLVGAVVAGARVHGWGARRLVTLLTRASAAMLLAGVAVGVGRWLATWSLHGAGAPGLAITLYFLLGGLLFAALARPGRTT